MSPLVKIPIKGYPYPNIEDIEKKTQPHRLVNCYVNEAGHYVKRAGFLKFVTNPLTTLKIQSMYYWREKDCVIAVSNKNIYKITSTGVMTNITGDQLSGLNRAVFAECLKDGVSYLAIADGSRIVSWDGAGTTTLIADPDAPVNCNYIAFIDLYLLATNNSLDFYSSEQNAFDTWLTDYIWRAGSNPDKIDAIVVAYREIYIFGKASIEIWRSTGSLLIFEPMVGAEVQDGCIAPYTIKEDDGIIYYLNKERRVIRLAGRDRTPISVPLDKVFAEFSTVTDATGDIIVIGGRKFYLLQFPTEGKSYICDLLGGYGWAEWLYWDTVNAEYKPFKGSCALYVPEWGKMLIGDKDNGNIYELTTAVYTDDGNPIRVLLTTGHIDYDTFKKKASHSIRLRLKRGVATASEPDPVIMLRWNNDNKGFTTPETWTSLGLGQTGVEEFYVYKTRNGMYRARQYEVAVTDAVQFILMEIEEEVEVLNT